RSRQRRSRRSRRSTGRSSCPSASGSFGSRTSGRSPSGSTRRGTRSSTTCRSVRRRSSRSSMLDFEPHHGLTHVLDKGLGPRVWEDVLEVAGDYISIVKLGWGTAAVTQNLERKLDVLKEKPVVIGGTFFEVVYAKGSLADYKTWLQRLGITHVETS